MLPVFLAIGAYASWRANLSRPGLFVVTATLSMIGMHAVLELLLNPFFGRLFYHPRDAIFPEHMSLLPSAIALVLLGVPFLKWLKSAF